MSTLEGILGKHYDLGQVVCVVGVAPIGGYGEEGGLEFEANSDLFEAAVGATGLPTFSKLNDDLWFVDITVMETSNAYLILGALLKAQQLAPIYVPLPFLMTDPNTGDSVSSATAVFMAVPAMNKARVAGERVFRLGLPGAGQTAVFGVLNVV